MAKIEKKRSRIEADRSANEQLVAEKYLKAREIEDKEREIEGMRGVLMTFDVVVAFC